MVRILRRGFAVGLGIAAALGAAELGLRASGFSPGSVNEGYMQFGYPEGIPAFDEDGVLVEGRTLRVRLFESDPETLWRPVPNTPVTNAYGFRGREDPVPGRDPGRLRVAYVGDSCTFLGNPVYPDLIDAVLEKRFPAFEFDCINAACPGYSSFQGTKVLARVRPWEPVCVVINFGWNDHYRAQGGLTDAEQYAVLHAPRIVGLVWAWLAARRDEPVLRGPIEDYERHLRTIRDAVLGWGAVPIFVTAPSGFQEGAMPDWAYDFFREYYGMQPQEVDLLPRRHAAQVEVVRRVAARPPCVLIDAAAEFERRGLSVDEVFRQDRAHFRPAGHRWMAELVGPAVLDVVRSEIERRQGVAR